MALNQIIQHQTGAYCSYWKVIETILNYHNKNGKIIMFGYVNEQTRNENKNNLDYRIFDINSNDFELYFTPSAINPENINQVKNSYLYIKNTNEFITSTDC